MQLNGTTKIQSYLTYLFIYLGHGYYFYKRRIVSTKECLRDTFQETLHNSDTWGTSCGEHGAGWGCVGVQMCRKGGLEISWGQGQVEVGGMEWAGRPWQGGVRLGTGMPCGGRAPLLSAGVVASFQDLGFPHCRKAWGELPACAGAQFMTVV